MSEGTSKFLIGWREWVGLPGLCVDGLKAKVDTGAKTSALHAIEIETYHASGRRRVKFYVEPLQTRSGPLILCHSEVIDERIITDSGGHRERRLVIKTELGLGDANWPIEISLTDRKSMSFRMLLGREAIHSRTIIDPDASFLTGTHRQKLARAQARELRRRAK